MAASTPIGKVDKYILKTRSPLGQDTETTLSNKFVFNSESTYSQVDTASRAIANLSQDTYVNTILVTNMDVNEQISG